MQRGEHAAADKSMPSPDTGRLVYKGEDPQLLTPSLSSMPTQQAPWPCTALRPPQELSSTLSLTHSNLLGPFALPTYPSSPPSAVSSTQSAPQDGQDQAPPSTTPGLQPRAATPGPQPSTQSTKSFVPATSSALHRSPLHLPRCARRPPHWRRWSQGAGALPVLLLKPLLGRPYSAGAPKPAVLGMERAGEPCRR